ncbi:MAG: flagellar assembly protein FliW [Acetivibrionales bacterium]|jgi:flagellar assembly factor FliW|nr:flagellar assembly protein FliW [Clostridiaceae bacterium]
MQLETDHFGTIEIDENEFIYFPEGIPGFEKSNRFVLIGNNAGEEVFYWLQSVDYPDLCFVVTDPFMVYDGYVVDLEDEDVLLLQITDPSKVLTLAIVIIPEKIDEIRVNLKAPILINIEKKLGKQIILDNDNLPIRYYLNKKNT